VNCRLSASGANANNSTLIAWRAICVLALYLLLCLSKPEEIYGRR
jgi:hypothetical protein